MQTVLSSSIWADVQKIITDHWRRSTSTLDVHACEADWTSEIKCFVTWLLYNSHSRRMIRVIFANWKIEAKSNQIGWGVIMANLKTIGGGISCNELLIDEQRCSCKHRNKFSPYWPLLLSSDDSVVAIWVTISVHCVAWCMACCDRS